MGCLKKNESVGLSCIKIIICLFSITVLLIDPVYGNPGSKKETPGGKSYSEEREEMKLAFDNGDIMKVIEIYQRNCCMGKSGHPGKKSTIYEIYEEKEEFKHERKEIRADIYEMLVKTYDDLNSPKQVDFYLEKWLLIKHNEKLTNYFGRFIANQAENTYRVTPKFLLGFKVGANESIPEVGTQFSIFSSVDTTKPDMYKKNYQTITKSFPFGQNFLGCILEYSLTPSAFIKICPTFTTLKYKYDCEYTWGDTDSTGKTAAKFLHIQRISALDFPLLLKKSFHFINKPDLKWYIQAGGFLRYRISAYKMINVTIKSSGYPGEDLEKNKKITGLIMSFQGGIQFGAGFEWKCKKFLCQIELNYNRTLSKNMINKKNRYNYPEIEYGYYDLLDDVRLHHLSLSLNILMPLNYKIFRR